MRAHDLARFVDAQSDSYDTALAEIRSGQKRSHWMWFIFPQLRGLGHSAMAQHYGIASLDEARTYLSHPVLGPRYRTCIEAVDALGTDDPVAVFGTTDAMKLRSSLTLFEAAEPSQLIDNVLHRFFNGGRDAATQQMLSASKNATV
ncbi:DUF1810 domain-containing protein [Sphingobium sp. HWE2-09]|uniref:DUF1810 domain-containing protein n=1 Tax=Sphingobium sp. HWE2-09 TaxID=3108390 RepID=UPI002DCA57D8|nr:DUF1810 domain-containing protein [Sphingobium sp. HWE2-09]